MQVNLNANAKQLKVLAQITSLAKEESGIDVCWLYGSRARGQASEKSDYDLAIAINSNNATAASKKQEYYTDGDKSSVATYRLWILSRRQHPWPIQLSKTEPCSTAKIA